MGSHSYQGDQTGCRYSDEEVYATSAPSFITRVDRGHDGLNVLPSLYAELLP